MSDDHSQKFKNLRLQEEYDTHVPGGHRLRSKINEIVVVSDILFALTLSGICVAFSRETKQRICFLNVDPYEVIKGLHYNKNSDSLFLVSVYASDHLRSLKCRTIEMEYIWKDMPEAGSSLFESESFPTQSYIEYDDENGKILTFSAQDSIYKVFDSNNYMLLYSTSDTNVQEIIISGGRLLLIYNRATDHVPLKIISLEDGTIVKAFNHLLRPNKKMDIVGLDNEKVFVKQENENLQIVDIHDLKLMEVTGTEFITPLTIRFLSENQLFLTIRNGILAVWNLDGELVTSFEDLLFWHPNLHTNKIYITSDENLIISYCKDDSDNSSTEGNAAGCINISSILTGKCLAKLTAMDDRLPDDCIQDRWITSSVREALEDITAVFYHEERNEIYTGDRLGLVHVWSN